MSHEGIHKANLDNRCCFRSLLGISRWFSCISALSCKVHKAFCACEASLQDGRGSPGDSCVSANSEAIMALAACLTGLTSLDVNSLPLQVALLNFRFGFYGLPAAASI